jgi:ubiquinone/menaquinone biosynthesis C-methylase UbiE
MIAQAKNRFEDKVQLVQGDARNLGMFQKGDFAIIISGATMHNISKEEIREFWVDENC